MQYAITVRLAQIAAGGYHERKRALSPEQRSEVFSRYKGQCVLCGAPGTEVDHIRGSSNEPSNVQLLCTPCHRKKTELSFRAATSQEIAEVFEPIRKRATAPAPLQPSDTPDWAYRLWACDPLPSGNCAQEVWREVVKRDFPSLPLYSDLAEACAGFPERLAPWSWYKGPHEHTAGSVNSLRLASTSRAIEGHGPTTSPQPTSARCECHAMEVTCQRFVRPRTADCIYPAILPIGFR